VQKLPRPEAVRWPRKAEEGLRQAVVRHHDDDRGARADGAQAIVVCGDADFGAECGNRVAVAGWHNNSASHAPAAGRHVGGRGDVGRDDNVTPDASHADCEDDDGDWESDDVDLACVCDGGDLRNGGVNAVGNGDPDVAERKAVSANI
jgi:hypothetical protein